VASGRRNDEVALPFEAATAPAAARDEPRGRRQWKPREALSGEQEEKQEVRRSESEVKNRNSKKRKKRLLISMISCSSYGRCERLSAFHHEPHPLGGRDVLQHIAGDGDDVGFLAGFDRAGDPIDAEQRRGGGEVRSAAAARGRARPAARTPRRCARAG
jgi:hypothetical protein